MVETFDGEYVLYEDHLAAMEEKDKEYGKIFHRQLDVIKEQEKLLDHKDSTIKALVSLCLSNGIISRGLACTYLGCAREDLDDMLRVVEDGDVR